MMVALQILGGKNSSMLKNDGACFVTIRQLATMRHATRITKHAPRNKINFRRQRYVEDDFTGDRD
jgi:hypothetical protein